MLINRYFLIRFIFILEFFAMPLFAQQEGLKKGLLLLNEGKIEDAIFVFVDELKRNPDAPELYHALAITYTEKGDFEQARLNLENAILKDSKYIPAHYTLALIFEKEQKIKDAIKHWTYILQLSSEQEIRDLARKHIKHLNNLKRD